MKYLLITQLFFFQLNMTMGQSEEIFQKFQSILDNNTDEKKVFGASFAIKRDSLTWQGASGNLTSESPYFIASTTKLFTTAIILHLKSLGELELEDRINKYLDPSIMAALHIYKGKDFSDEITIKHLLAHTSGLPDYFQGKGSDRKSWEIELKNGNDQFWTFEKAIDRTKELKPLFKPGSKNKANYSDTNYQLLGKIIETITTKSYAKNCEELIIKPLQLIQTYLYTDISDTTPKTMYYKRNELPIPKAMTSFGADGGIVSTSADMLVFVEAFFSGRLFPKEYIDNLQEWNPIFFPMKSGVGIHLFKLPWVFNPSGVIPYFIGHSGLSGALAYFSPTENLYIVGTVNQIGHPDMSFKTMIKLARMALKY
jgi:D-alanyl-D-alanine carboxypeptidase